VRGSIGGPSVGSDPEVGTYPTCLVCHCLPHELAASLLSIEPVTVTRPDRLLCLSRCRSLVFYENSLVCSSGACFALSFVALSGTGTSEALKADKMSAGRVIAAAIAEPTVHQRTDSAISCALVLLVLKVKPPVRTLRAARMRNSLKRKELEKRTSCDAWVFTGVFQSVLDWTKRRNDETTFAVAGGGDGCPRTQSALACTGASNGMSELREGCYSACVQLSCTPHSAPCSY
jgi:hypothetical protein